MAEHGLRARRGRRRGCVASRSVCVATARTCAGAKPSQALREARQAVEAALRRLFGQQPVRVEAGAEAHGLLQVVDAPVAALLRAGRSRAGSCSSPCRSRRAARASATSASTAVARRLLQSWRALCGKLDATQSPRVRVRDDATSFLECALRPGLTGEDRMLRNDLDSLTPTRDFSRRDFVRTAVGSGFAAAVLPVSAQTIKTDSSGPDGRRGDHPGRRLQDAGLPRRARGQDQPAGGARRLRDLRRARAHRRRRAALRQARLPRDRARAVRAPGRRQGSYGEIVEAGRRGRVARCPTRR